MIDDKIKANKMRSIISKAKTNVLLETQRDLLEAYKAITDDQIITSEIDGEQACAFCGNEANEDHELGCIVLKAQSFIDSIEGKSSEPE